ncbi:hypothetical protein BT63DRAFT_466977 [Microthyrium microscopicum]|uniref:Uncharacterized protein n=1 Tax=Microthyrium microscopicum TaxID=703497 RepID=A0A6A6UQU8_9PEZI|nr:hypothetical protein BT63DRAFT_466977 [Microthyrium microscopicum]
MEPLVDSQTPPDESQFDLGSMDLENSSDIPADLSNHHQSSTDQQLDADDMPSQILIPVPNANRDSSASNPGAYRLVNSAQVSNSASNGQLDQNTMTIPASVNLNPSSSGLQNPILIPVPNVNQNPIAGNHGAYRLVNSVQMTTSSSSGQQNQTTATIPASVHLNLISSIQQNNTQTAPEYHWVSLRRLPDLHRRALFYGQMAKATRSTQKSTPPTIVPAPPIIISATPAMISAQAAAISAQSALVVTPTTSPSTPSNHQAAMSGTVIAHRITSSQKRKKQKEKQQQDDFKEFMGLFQSKLPTEVQLMVLGFLLGTDNLTKNLAFDSLHLHCGELKELIQMFLKTHYPERRRFKFDWYRQFHWPYIVGGLQLRADMNTAYQKALLAKDLLPMDLSSPIINEVRHLFLTETCWREFQCNCDLPEKAKGMPCMHKLMKIFPNLQTVEFKVRGVAPNNYATLQISEVPVEYEGVPFSDTWFIDIPSVITWRAQSSADLEGGRYWMLPSLPKTRGYGLFVDWFKNGQVYRLADPNRAFLKTPRWLELPVTESEAADKAKLKLMEIRHRFLSLALDPVKGPELVKDCAQYLDLMLSQLPDGAKKGNSKSHPTVQQLVDMIQNQHFQLGPYSDILNLQPGPTNSVVTRFSWQILHQRWST